MPTRKYNLETRQRKQADLKDRIVAATANLHASRGVAATSYADIARLSGVSLPTVHSHYPTLDVLLQGCTAHVAASAPALPVEKILEAGELAVGAKLLVAAVAQQHLHFEPWLAWRENGLIPFLADMSDGIRQQQSELVARLLEHHLGPGKRREMIAGCESLISFDFWHRLVRGHGLTPAAARRVSYKCLLANIGLPPASSPTSSPRRKTK
ncbi:MAG: TetR/AcrR family transcriptional regulator [Gammaproteobacteria bacterium]